MVNRYQVLSAMLALDEFTAQQLADYAAVNVNTVRTVLARNRAWFASDGRQETGRPGGRPRILRLRSGAADEIRAELDSLYAQLPEPPSAIETDADLPMLAVENALGQQFLEARSEEERKDALALAREMLQVASRAVASVRGRGRRIEDVARRHRLAALERLLGAVEDGILPLESISNALEHARARDGTEWDEAHEGEGAIVLVCAPGPEEEVSRHERSRTSLLHSLAEKIRSAAVSLGAPVWERRSDLPAAAEKLSSTVFLVADSSRRGWPDSGFWKMVDSAPARVVLLDLAWNVLLQNRLMARENVYVPRADSLDDEAITGAVARFGSSASHPAELSLIR